MKRRGFTTEHTEITEKKPERRKELLRKRRRALASSHPFLSLCF
jgi:hypothetical protein